MPEKKILCAEITELYNKCYDNIQCHEDIDKTIRYKSIKLDCYHIKQLYKICNGFNQY